MVRTGFSMIFRKSFGRFFLAFVNLVLLFIEGFGERTWIRLTRVKINNSSCEFVPLFFMVFSKMITDFHDQVIKGLDSAIHVGFLWISN
jgi:hypothetical protein